MKDVTLVNCEYLGPVLDEGQNGLMKIHEDLSVTVIAKYSVLQITMSLLYLTSEIKTNFVGTCTATRIRRFTPFARSLAVSQVRSYTYCLTF